MIPDRRSTVFAPRPEGHLIYYKYRGEILTKIQFVLDA